MFGPPRYTVGHYLRLDGSWRTFIHDAKLNSGSGVDGYYPDDAAVALLVATRQRIGAK